MWDKIKRILQKEGDQCIIIEEGQPSYLVKKLENGDETEKVNRDIDHLKAEESEEKQEVEMTQPENQEVRVEDLPF